MPCRFPWLATVALVVTTIAAAILLRVASARQGALPAPDGGSARHAAPAPVPGDGTAGLPGLADGRRR